MYEQKVSILIDLRCLNYEFITGVNAYTLRFLHCIWELKKQNKNWIVIGLGLKQKRKQQLESEFNWLKELFSEHIDTSQYFNFLTKNNKINETRIVLKSFFKQDINNNSIQKFDYLFLPQPRTIFKNPNTKLITVVHDLFSIVDNSNNLTQKLIYSKQNLRKILQSSYQIIGNSISTCNDIKKVFNIQNKINLVYPALPDIRSINTKTQILQTKQLNININQPYILALSGIEKRKNWFNLILAYKQLQSKVGINCPHLILAGTVVDLKHYKQLVQLIKNLKINNIHWVHQPDEEQKSYLIKNCEIFIYPSIYEGFGFPILEAKKYNRKIITSNISSMPEVGQDNCFYTNPFDYTNIASCLFQNIQQKNKISQINICNNKIKKFDWQELINWLSLNIQ